MSDLRKTHKRLISSLGLITIAVFGIISTLGTGGGGGDGDGVQPLTYSGNENPAAITLTNAPTLVANVLYGGISSSNIPIAATISSSNSQLAGAIVIADDLLSLFHYSMDSIIGNTISGYNIPSSVAVNETIYCESGYYTLQGTIDEYTLSGTLNFNYVNCLTEDITYNGSGSITINYIDPYGTYLDAVMSFTLLTASSADFNGSISGTMGLVSSLSGNTETDTMTMNYIAKDNNTGKMYKYENMILISVINDIYSFNSSGYLDIDDHAYDSIHGFVVVNTTNALLYSDIMNLIYPDNGGVMQFTGNNSSMQLTVLSERHVRLELNLDGTAGYEVVRTLLWDELAVNANTDLTDTDGDGMHDSWETTYGLDPNTDDSAGDLDLDTFSNLTEYQAGTNPNNAASHP
jgi:hypothetical protein